MRQTKAGKEQRPCWLHLIQLRIGLAYRTKENMEKCLTHEVADMFVEYGRLRDLMIVPVPEAYDQWYAEAVIFGTGKPILVLPEEPHVKPFKLNTAVVAWDFSRAAARTIADAIPILENAKENDRIVTVANEKVLDTKHSGEELAKTCRGTAST